MCEQVVMKHLQCWECEKYNETEGACESFCPLDEKTPSRRVGFSVVTHEFGGSNDPPDWITRDVRRRARGEPPLDIKI